jgi:hypothetical protein
MMVSHRRRRACRARASLWLHIRRVAVGGSTVGSMKCNGRAMLNNASFDKRLPIASAGSTPSTRSACSTPAAYGERKRSPSSSPASTRPVARSGSTPRGAWPASALPCLAELATGERRRSGPPFSVALKNRRLERVSHGLLQPLRGAAVCKEGGHCRSSHQRPHDRAARGPATCSRRCRLGDCPEDSWARLGLYAVRSLVAPDLKDAGSPPGIALCNGCVARRGAPRWAPPDCRPRSRRRALYVGPSAR